MSRIFLLIGIILFILENSVSLLSIKEKQYLAARRSFLLSMLLSFPFLFLSVINFPYQNIIGLSLTLLAGVFLVLLLIPFPSKKDKNYKKPITRIDERDTMFSRNRLKKGSTHYKNYYLENPDKKEIDDKIRSNPGLLAKNTKYYHNYWFQAADTNFAHVKQLRSKVDGKVSSSKSKFALSSKSNTAFIKNWLRNLNVLDTGITLLKDYHIYSYGGRDERYGKKLTLEHKFAIAFTIPMNYELVNCAPQASMVFESSRCY
ncbi:MAG: hypothetical protein K9M80_04320, partial [Candidatus Marinimicrobia bacterium]|nr:hypothetical protein [Candidatus Neomarinimicrobiota bacterium]